MPWTNQGGGSGGGGGGGGGPWGGGGGGRGPWGGGGPGGPGQPNIEELLRRSQDRFKRFFPGGSGNFRVIIGIIVVALVIWGASGFFRVQPDELGVRLTFGKMIGTSPPGLNYNWPAPIGEVLTPKVTNINRTEVGFRRSAGAGGRGEFVRDVSEESLMLTGDENIIDVQVVVFWKIDTRQLPASATGGRVVIQEGVRNFLFNIRNPAVSVKDAAEAALREIVGKSEFEFARTEGRVRIEGEAQQLIQSILDDYGAGVEVTRVQLQKVDPPGTVLDSFRDVQAARADMERKMNEAFAYRNEIVQRALGEAARIRNGAEGYKQEVIAVATGEASRFLAIYEQYLKEKEVTKRRLYLETMQEVMRNMDKILIDNRLGGTGVVPYLPLDQLTRPRSGAGSSGEAR
jgi:membrane protease subunit HflK